MGVEPGAVEGRIVIGVPQRPFHPLQLQGGDFIAGGGLDRLQIAGTGGEVFHGSLLGQVGALDAARMAAEFGNLRAVLPGYTDVVDAAAPLPPDLGRAGCQHVALLPRGKEGDLAHLRHDALVVGVAGEGEGAVRQREDIAAVADLVAVGHLGPGAHGHRGVTGADIGEFHPQMLRRVVIGPHGGGAGAGEFVGRHLPLNSAGRLSRKAATPSA